jgi:hypothetical protein
MRTRQINQYHVEQAERNLPMNGFSFYNNRPLPPISVIDTQPTGFRCFSPFGGFADSPGGGAGSPSGGAGSTTVQTQMEQYLQGLLPDYTIDPATGSLVPKSSGSLTTALLLAGVGVGIWYLFFNKR